MRSLDEVLIRLCDLFNKARVEYVLIGDFAVIMHGYPRTTQDIDFFIRNSDRNISQIREILAKEMSDNEALTMTKQDLDDYAVVRYGSPDGIVVDLIARLGSAFDFDRVSKNTTTFEINGVPIVAAGLDTLIDMKNTVRPQDRADLAFLVLKKQTLADERSQQ